MQIKLRLQQRNLEHVSKMFVDHTFCTADHNENAIFQYAIATNIHRLFVIRILSEDDRRNGLLRRVFGPLDQT